jgi:hypothetical protein
VLCFGRWLFPNALGLQRGLRWKNKQGWLVEISFFEVAVRLLVAGMLPVVAALTARLPPPPSELPPIWLQQSARLTHISTLCPLKHARPRAAARHALLSFAPVIQITVIFATLQLPSNPHPSIQRREHEQHVPPTA